MARLQARQILMLVLVAAMMLGFLAPTATASDSQIGFRAHLHGGADDADGGNPTGNKNESKLWYHDGIWWSAMYSELAGGTHTIHRLQGTTWVDTGVIIGGRTARVDALVVGNTLYTSMRNTSQLMRFTYRASNRTWTADAGFPVALPVRTDTEVLSIDRDTTGRLWLAWMESQHVHTAHSDDNGRTWSPASVIPVGSATHALSDDVAAVVAFTDSTGPAIGVMWSNQRTDNQWFAVHRDGAADDDWTLESALSGNQEADDHISLKTFEGRVYASVKTEQNQPGRVLIRLLVRSPRGNWASHPVAFYEERDTRPITVLAIDPADRTVYVFMTKTRGVPKREIVYKRSSLDGIGFPTDPTTIIRGDQDVNNVTSFKANATAATGIVVMASSSSHYWWNRIGGAPGDPGDPGDPGNPGDVLIADTATGTATSSDRVTSGSIGAATNAVYVASVATRRPVDVTSVDGLGLKWAPVAAQCGGRSQTGISLWIASGSPPGGGAVTARLGTQAHAASIGVARYTGVDPDNPVGPGVGANTNGIDGGCSRGTDTAGYSVPTPHGTSGVLVGAVTMRNTDHEPGPGFTEHLEVRAGTGGHTTGLAMLDGPILSSSPSSVTGTFSGNVDWAVATTSLRPAGTADAPGDPGTPDPEPDQYTLTIDTQGQGTVALDPPGGIYDDGTNVTLTATPGNGWSFKNWSGDATGTSTTTAVTVDDDLTVTATFIEDDDPADPDPTDPGDPGEVTFAEATTGTATESDRVVTDTALGTGPGAVYLASVGTRHSAEVRSVEGLGLTWSRVAAQCSGRSQARLELWVATGQAPANSIVEARLESTARSVALSVVRYHGANQTNPVSSAIQLNTNGVDGSCSGGTDSNHYTVAVPHAPGSSLVHLSATMRGRAHTPQAPYTQRATALAGSGGDAASIASIDGPLATTSPTSAGGTFSSTVDWAVIATTLRSAS